MPKLPVYAKTSICLYLLLIGFEFVTNNDAILYLTTVITDTGHWTDMNVIFGSIGFDMIIHMHLVCVIKDRWISS